MTKGLTKVFSALGIILALVLILYLNTAGELESFVSSLGPFGPIGIILYIVISHIFAPVVGSPGLLLSVTLYGVPTTVILLYISGLISSITNFFIAKLFGRGALIKLIGEERITDIDLLVERLGKKLLIICRLFGFPVFEIISYAAGLTKISFRTYFVITASVGLIPNFLLFVAFRNGEENQMFSLLIFMSILIGTGFAFIVSLRAYLNKDKSSI